MDEVSRSWLSKLEAAGGRLPARELYCGRAFREASAAAEAVRARLFIVSAGLGLVSSATLVPSYSLTVAGGSPDTVLQRIRPTAPPSAWWAQIATGSSFSRGFAEIGREFSADLILLAVPGLYLGMIEEELLQLPPSVLARLRLFGLNLRPNALLKSLVMPYDERLEDAQSTFRGTRSDFASRALRHFVEVVLPHRVDASADQHHAAVNETLSAWREPRAIQRPRISDGEVKRLIRVNWDHVGGRSSQMLRFLRDHLQVACEQGRFRKLFGAVCHERDAQP